MTNLEKKIQDRYRVSKNYCGYYEVETTSGLIERVFSTMNRKKAEGVAEYLNQQHQKGGNND